MEQEFIENLKEVLEIEDREIGMSDEFKKYEEWDSLAYLSVIAMIDEKYDKQISDAVFKQLSTVRDLFNAIID
ncbi:MAG: acyl carrier protein [Prevotellaceae bacterium]|jgi:acyl carrier protein|nr:acyl carrier protein [Prevotellaceae bacterium]